MYIKVNDISLDVWVRGCPVWVHIEQGDRGRVSMRLEEAKAVVDGLINLIEYAEKEAI